MRVRVDPIKCQGYAICVEVAPKNFTLDDWGFAQAVAIDSDEQSESLLEEAIEVCPVRAIRRLADS